MLKMDDRIHCVNIMARKPGYVLNTAHYTTSIENLIKHVVLYVVLDLSKDIVWEIRDSANEHLCSTNNPLWYLYDILDLFSGKGDLADYVSNDVSDLIFVFKSY